jgi:hypothetical protein
LAAKIALKNDSSTKKQKFINLPQPTEILCKYIFKARRIAGDSIGSAMRVAVVGKESLH